MQVLSQDKLFQSFIALHLHAQVDNPDSKKVAEVASAAGEKWRSLSEDQKRGYEESSEKAKASRLHLLATPPCVSVVYTMPV